VDPITHGLASFALKRGFFPRAERPVLISMIVAGTLADLDWLSVLAGPAAYLKWRGGIFHSILAALLISLVVSFAIRAYAKSRGVLLTGTLWLIAPVSAGLLHVGMDVLLFSGMAVFWPLSTKRIALDWAPDFDLWLLILLLAGILLPELFRLVGNEIGAKSKKPRGQSGAVVAFAFIAIYFVARGMFHADAAIMIMQRSYSGESARRGAAFPDSTSPLVWHCVVETESAIHLLDVPAGPLAKFDPETALHIHKPEASPMLDAAQKTDAAQQFLNFARFPKATVQPESEGFSVEISDLKNAALSETTHAVEVQVDLNLAGQPTYAHIEWQNKPRK
jgi:membrane-bound metal-dependent hydrolase YbcI (DUF457 family)